ncbi:hypothetical protein C8R42DRAFT_723262 [Lentinula raphanica]|nr:hypothetical protein C8R42DRAFT_723262 [Lentinula raphanica]
MSPISNDICFFGSESGYKHLRSRRRSQSGFSTRLGEINSLDSKLSFLAATVAQDKRALCQKIVVMSEDEVDDGSALSMGTSSVGRRVDTTSSGLPSHGLDTDTRSKAHSSPSSPPVSLAAFETLWENEESRETIESARVIAGKRRSMDASVYPFLNHADRRNRLI